MELSPNVKRFAAAASAALLTGCAGLNLDARDNGNLSVRNAPEHSGPKDFGSEACRAAAIEVSPVQNMGNYRNRFPNIYRAWQTNPSEVTVRSNVTGQNYVMVSRGIDLRLGQALAGAVTGRAIIQNERQKRGDRSIWEATRDGVKAGIAMSISTGVAKAFEDAFHERGAMYRDRCMGDIMAGAYDGYTYDNSGATVKFRQPIGLQQQPVTGQPGTSGDWYQRRSQELNLR